MRRRIRGLAGLAAVPAVLALAGTPARAADGFTPAQRQEIVTIVRDALRQDPSILRDALANLEASERQDRQEASSRAVAANRAALVSDPVDPVRGNPQGRVTVVEFFDARCGYCKAMQPAIDQLLRENRNVRLVLKDLPILGPNSVLASRALLAAQKQNKYAELYDALLRLHTEPNEETLRAQAQSVGLDWARLRRDMDDPAVATRLQSHLQLARTLGIEGTPALVIGDKLIPGALDLPQLQQAVADAAR